MEINHLRFALEASGIGIWDFNPSAQQVVWDAKAKELFGFAKEETFSYSDIFKYTHPDDIDMIESALAGALASEAEKIEISYRTINSENLKETWIRIKGKKYIDDIGNVCFTGTVEEISSEIQSGVELKDSETRFLSLIEQAPVATCLLVGQDMMIEIANQIMLDYWGRDKAVIGLQIADALPELKNQEFLQILHDVYTSGIAYKGNKTPANLLVGGVLRTFYFDFTYQPIHNQEGKVYAVMNMSVDVTDKVVARQKMQESQSRFRAITEQSPIAIGLLKGKEMIVEIGNDKIFEVWGKDRSIIGKPIVEALPEIKDQMFLGLLENVYDTGEPYYGYAQLAKLEHKGIITDVYFDFTYSPLKDEIGAINGILVLATDVTQRVVTMKKIADSEAKFRSLINAAPAGIGLFVGRDLVVEMPNQTFIDIVGKGPDIEGKPLREVMPELENQTFLQILDDVYTSGKMFQSYGTQVNIVQHGVMTHNYYNITYTPLLDSEGKVYAILDIAIDVTERVVTTKKIAESEAKFKTLINAAPTSIAVFKGENFVIDIANQAFYDIVGRDEKVVGKPLLEVMPELKGQESIKLMQEVYTTGIKHHSYGRQVTLVNKGVVTNNYYNVSYTPLFDAEGKVYAILDTAIDVTESIKARQAIEETQASLKDAIELAELATWSLDPRTMQINYSERLLQWFGLKENSDTESLAYVLDLIHENDRERVGNSIMYALNPESGGMYEEEYTIINYYTGRERILHAQGRAFFKNGKAYTMTGTAHDITNHKKLQLALENEVKERTDELQEANRELEDANRRLINSNEELAQYAYVASHDLQEPLRKISMFSNLLSDRDEEQKHKPIIDKILNSSKRMSLLIKDLLEFSRLLNPDIRFVPTNLNEIVKAVKDDFELLIEEKNAVLEIGPLPVIAAVPLQMNQLFYNLISNALKFIPEGTKPLITVSYKKISDEEKNYHVHNAVPYTDYYKISVSDNGIGIEDQYLKQIFEVFKRLHGRDEYYGSGIGLAICRRIVNNHHGTIIIDSEVGKGTSFHIILPEKQSKSDN